MSLLICCMQLSTRPHYRSNMMGESQSYNSNHGVFAFLLPYGGAAGALVRSDLIISTRCTGVYQVHGTGPVVFPF